MEAAPMEAAPDRTASGPEPASRPLRRRVRGATLRTTADASAANAHESARPADAEAVRSALEEFEEAVERAHRDTAAPPASPPTSSRPATPGTHRQNDLPEGAEQ
ncbi:hypothetical protein CF54_08730 [Streptomyces sp. Tu 6176]|nr:hypothetical protein CF54_08730 [Streptomyces sp. Tu 6176]